MIIRSFGVRHGRKALAAPIALGGPRSRHLSTETTPSSSSKSTPPTTTTPTADHGASSTVAGAAAASLPRVFSKAARQARARREAAERQHAVAAYRAKQQVRELTQTLGSVVRRRHDEDALLADPPGVDDVTLELLMANQTHVGHHTSLWNPSNARFLYGSRQGVHVISLEETAAHLRRAAKVVEAVAHAGGLVLFVGTRKGQMELVTRAAALAGGCHLFTKWTPGAITNRDVILAGAGLHVVDPLDRPLDGFGKHLAERRPVAPDLVVCLNPLENYVLLRECGQKNIPTIGVIDTDADPTWVTYCIPANDDSMRSVGVIASVLGRAGQAGQQRRLAEAKEGQVTWNTPTDLHNYIKSEHKKFKESGAGRAGKKRSGGDAALLGPADEVAPVPEGAVLEADVVAEAETNSEASREEIRP